MTVRQILTWTYSAQRVIEIGGHSLYQGEVDKNEQWSPPAYHWSADGCAQIARNAILGVAIDGSGPIRGISQSLHPDAELVHEIVRSLPWGKANMLVQFGRTGTEPQLPPAPSYHRVTERDERGRWKTKIKRAFDWELECKIIWCPVVLSPDPADIEVFSTIFATWLQALDALGTKLADAPLRSIEIV